MDNILYEFLTSYYNTLFFTGYVKDKITYKLLVYCFYIDLVKNDFRCHLSKDDYRMIEEILDCFYGTNCLMPYPDYLKMGKLHLGEITEIACRLKNLEDTDVVKVADLYADGISDIVLSERNVTEYPTVTPEGTEINPDMMTYINQLRNEMRSNDEIISSSVNSLQSQMNSVVDALTPDSGGGTEPEIVDKWYIGDISRTADKFSEVDANTLVKNATAYPVTSNSATYTVNESILYVMVPSGVQVKNAVYRAASIDSTIKTESSSWDTGSSNCSHSNITINGMLYTIYAHRNSELQNSGATAYITIG